MLTDEARAALEALLAWLLDGAQNPTDQPMTEFEERRADGLATAIETLGSQDLATIMVALGAAHELAHAALHQAQEAGR